MSKTYRGKAHETSFLMFFISDPRAESERVGVSHMAGSPHLDLYLPLTRLFFWSSETEFHW